MPVDLTAKGKIELKDSQGNVISRHTVEREALQRITSLPVGKYTITYPNVEAVVSIAHMQQFSAALSIAFLARGLGS